MRPTTKTRVYLLGIICLTIITALLAWPKGPDFLRDEVKLHLGLDLAGGAHLVYEADVAEVPAGEQAQAVAGTRDVIERRVNALGIGEPVVQTNRTDTGYRIIVELPGVSDVKQAIKMIGETPVLEFKEMASPVPLTAEEKTANETFNTGQSQKAATILAELKNSTDATFSAKATAVSEDVGSKDKGGDIGFVAQGMLVPEFEDVLFNKLKDGEMYGEVVTTDYGYHLIRRVATQCKDKASSKVIACPAGAIDPEKVTQEVQGRHILLLARSTSAKMPADTWQNTPLSGKQLKVAKVIFDQQSGLPIISLEFNDDGAKLFEQITERNVNQQVAIFLDGEVISAPRVNEKISGGKAVITGNFTIVESRELAKRLNAGALPVKITLISQQQIGATLGQESVQDSFLAGVIGMILIMIFMISYYRLPGVVAAISLCIYGLILIAIFKLVPVVLTLSGVAGFILTIGLAVDANVLIFERLKEELRAGKSLQAAIDEGFSRAWTSIRDSNVSTLITAFVLIWLGESLIKGFGITTALGIFVSMFAAMCISRVLLKLIAGLGFKNKWWWGV